MFFKQQIKTKTVAQCVEFYYTYKKQVKIGRNGTLIFGDIDGANERSMKDEAEVDIKVSNLLNFSHLSWVVFEVLCVVSFTGQIKSTNNLASPQASRLVNLCPVSRNVVYLQTSKLTIPLSSGEEFP